MTITLRKMVESDLENVLKIRNDPDTYKFLHTPKKFSIEDATDWFNKSSPVWYIIENENEMVGYIRTSEWDFIRKSVWIGCDIDKSHRRKGYAFEAYNNFIKNLKQCGCNTVYLSVLKNNTKAFNLYKKLGFETFTQTKDSFHMQLKIGDSLNSGKGIKVIPCYFGDRRKTQTAGRGPYNAKETLALLEFIWKCECTLDQGYPYDTYFIHNKLLPTDLTSTPEYVDKCVELLNSFDNKKTANGVARVVTRDNVGISFGAFAFAFDCFHDFYDYWFFTEDDQVIVKENVFVEAIKQLAIPDDDKLVGFVATVGVNWSWGPCAMGACGISSREIMKNVTKSHYSNYYKKHTLPFKYVDVLKDKTIQTNNSHESEGEVRFTQIIAQMPNYCLAEHILDDINVSWQDTAKRTRNCTEFKDYMISNEIIIYEAKCNEIKEGIFGLWKQSNIEHTFRITEDNCSFKNMNLNGKLQVNGEEKIQIIWDNGVIYNLFKVDDSNYNVQTSTGENIQILKI